MRQMSSGPDPCITVCWSRYLHDVPPAHGGATTFIGERKTAANDVACSRLPGASLSAVLTSPRAIHTVSSHKSLTFNVTLSRPILTGIRLCTCSAAYVSVSVSQNSGNSQSIQSSDRTVIIMTRRWYCLYCHATLAGPLGDTPCHPLAGSVLLFTQDLLHEGSEVKAGIKYTMRSEVMYRR